MFPRREIERVRILTILDAMRRAGRRAVVLPPGVDGFEIIEQIDYHTRAAAGMCTRPGCRNPPRPGRKLCEGCAAAQRDRAAAIRARRKAAGLCADCGGPSDGAARCETCRRDYRPGGRWPGSDSRAAGRRRA